MKLNKLKKIKSKKSKRLGRGYGSGRGGHTVGKGQKGQQSRSGFKKMRGWVRESKVKSLPKLKGIGKRLATRGYFTIKRNNVVLNVSDLEAFESGAKIDMKFLKDKGVIRKKSKRSVVKILGNGKLSKKFTVSGIATSRKAKDKIEEAGGEVL
jgi:large subunit ribosomal protein L15